MNAAQRKALSELKIKVEALKGQLETYKEDVTLFQEEEQGKFDNLSEGLQQGDKGQAIEEAANILSEAVEELDSAVDSLENFINNIEEAIA